MDVYELTILVFWITYHRCDVQYIMNGQNLWIGDDGFDFRVLKQKIRSGSHVLPTAQILGVCCAVVDVSAA